MPYPTSVDTGQIQPLVIGPEYIFVTGSSGVMPTANGVFLYAFELTSNVVIPSMKIRVTATATGTTDMGIYDINGNLLGHTGAITNVANTMMINNLTAPLNLAPGQYYLAFCPLNITDTYIRTGAAATQSVGSRFRLATNSGSAGVLPATTGGISATGTANQPGFVALVTGGLA